MVNVQELLKKKQQLWARRHSIPLGGQYRHHQDRRQAARGEKTYTFQVEQNLYEPLTPEEITEYEEGDGSELKYPRAKMACVHSSAALCVNTLGYWRHRDALHTILSLLRAPSAHLESCHWEEKLSISDKFSRPPNLDAVFHYGPSSRTTLWGVEAKFTEPFDGRPHGSLKRVYLTHPEVSWENLSNTRNLAEELSSHSRTFRYLDASQLVRHILALKANDRRKAARNDHYGLTYLYYDAPGREGCAHRREAEEFERIARMDGVRFRLVTFQQLILGLARLHRESHLEYIDWVVERYL